MAPALLRAALGFLILGGAVLGFTLAPASLGVRGRGGRPPLLSGRARGLRPAARMMADEGGNSKRDPVAVATDVVLQVGGAFALARLVTVGFAKLAERNSPGVKGPEEGGVDWEALRRSGELSSEAYRVLHNSGTERPWSSPLNAEERSGVFACAACGTDLFDAETKFDSGTGWPSFYDALEGVELDEDNVLDKTVNMRQESRCSKCGGHLGHVFGDGLVWRVPTGKRYCINGASLKFKPKALETQ